MRLINLIEARARVFIKGNGESVMFSTTKRAGTLPFLVVIPLNGRKGDEFYTIGITPVGKARAKEISRGKYYGNVSSEDEAEYDMFIKYAIGQSSSFAAYPKNFKYQAHRDRKSFFKTILVDFKLGIHEAEAMFGTSPESDDTIWVGDAELLMLPGANRITIKLASDMIRDLSNLLDPLGLHGLVAGRYQITNLGGKVVGLYSYSDKWTSVDIPQLRKGRVMRTMIHEAGHKWDDQAGLKELIQDKYIELLRAGVRYSSKPDIEKNTVLIYQGSIKKLKGLPFVVRLVFHDAFMAVQTDRDGIIHRQHTIKFDTIAKTDDLMMADGSKIKFINGNPWFPTQYSMTNAREFHAELFVEYVYGRAAPEVVEWIESLPKP